MEQITREDIKRLRDVSHRQRDRAYLGAGSIIRGRYEALLDMAEAHLAEPARLAAARVEGVREGIEIAARYHEGKADVYRDNRAQFGFLHTSYAAEIRSLSPAPAPWTPTHRHYKGGLYREIERLPDRSDDGARPEGIVVYEGEDGRRHSIDARRFDGMVAAYALDGAVSPTGEYARRFEPINPAPAEEQRILAQRRFRNELAREIRITIEGPSSISENTLTPAEAAHLRDALVEAIPAPAEAPKALTRCQAASLRNDGECSHPLCPVPHGSKGVDRLVCTLPGAGDDYVDEDDLPLAEAPTTTTAGASDGWIEWSGGECPLPEYCRVPVRYRSKGTTEVQAGLARWTHTGAWDDIVAIFLPTIEPPEASAPVAYTPLQRMKMDLDAIRDASVAWKEDHATMENLRARFAWLGEHDEETGRTEFKVIEARIAALEAENAALRERGALVVQALDGPGANAQLLVSAVDGLRALLQGQGGADA